MQFNILLFFRQARYIVFALSHTLSSAESQRFFMQEDHIMTKDCTNGGCACTPNQSIKCTVNNCAHHCQDNQYCGLDTIQVGTHEANPTQIECTDCQSFKLK